MSPSAFFAAASRAVDKGNDRAVREEWFEDAEVTVIVEGFSPSRKAAQLRTSRYGVEGRRNCEKSAAAQHGRENEHRLLLIDYCGLSDAGEANDAASTFGYRRVVLVLEVAARKQTATHRDCEGAGVEVVDDVFGSNAARNDKLGFIDA